MGNARLSKFWDSLRASYWFLPALMAIAAIALAFMLLTLDTFVSDDMKYLGWFYTGGPDGARALLSTVAGSMMTVAVTAFSITIVALQLASSNFGPRLLRNFMQDTGNQIVLGTFIATFIYCLLVLRTIRGEDYDFFVPHLSVTMGIVLAISDIGVLIYFIHHASTIIQVSHVIAEVSDEFDKAIERLYPEKIGQGPPDDHLQVNNINNAPKDFSQEVRSISAATTGYLQAIDSGALMKIACHHNLLLRVLVRPGQFVVKGNEIAIAYLSDRVNQRISNQISGAFIFGKERTERQDVEFPIIQLVEIALRAISPAVNDPFTAIRCIDRLSAGLNQLAQRKFPSPYRYDDSGHLHIIAEPVTFHELVDSAFSQIRLYAKSDRAVTIRLLQAIEVIASHTPYANRKTALEQQAEMIFQRSCTAFTIEHDQKAVKEQYQKTIQAIRGNSPMHYC